MRGPLTTSTPAQLPTDAVMIRRGSLLGRVLITENTSIRQVELEPSGHVTEVELFGFVRGYAAVPGAIGMQP